MNRRTFLKWLPVVPAALLLADKTDLKKLFPKKPQEFKELTPVRAGSVIKVETFTEINDAIIELQQTVRKLDT